MGGQRELLTVEVAQIEAGLDLPAAAARVGRVDQAAAVVDDLTDDAPGAGQALPERRRADLADAGAVNVGHAEDVTEQVSRP